MAYPPGSIRELMAAYQNDFNKARASTRRVHMGRSTAGQPRLRQAPWASVEARDPVNATPLSSRPAFQLQRIKPVRHGFLMQPFWVRRVSPVLARRW